MADRDDRAPSRSLIQLVVAGAEIVGSGIVIAIGVYKAPLTEAIRAHAVAFGLLAALLVSLFIIWKLQFSGVKGYGLLRGFPERDPAAHQRLFKALRAAKNIRMLGFNLRSAGLKTESNFDELMEDRLKAEADLTLRILIADPDLDSVARRNALESRGDRTNRLKAEIDDVMKYVQDLRERTKGKIEIKLVDAEMIRASVIIADETMMATWYLSSRRGSKSPTFEIYGSQSPFFKAFDGEFELLWQKGKAI